MIPGLRGTLLSHEAIETVRLPTPPNDPEPAAGRRQLERWHTTIARESGPAWSARLVLDRIAIPFCAAFGVDLTCTGSDVRNCRGVMRRGGTRLAAALVTPWGGSHGSGWRDTVRAALPAGCRWCYCFTGPDVRIFDARRTHSRRFLLLDLEEVARREETYALLWRLLSSPTALDEAVAVSERHRVQVRESLQLGVRDALTHLSAAFQIASRKRRRPADAPSITDESLIVIYRVLFLLFAEARGLVPMWHPVFRESYTIESMREAIETRPRPRGIWDALQAITRLAHRGCRAGPLRVAPFNGRLFSPAHAPLAATSPLDEGSVRGALLALTTRKTRDGRQRISYADLDVEHLGGVYERVLDYDVTTSGATVTTGRRKATGTFYTPRPLTEYLVRRTLAPLVRGADPDRILSLRILDPAMGSGAFLVAACRYLAGAYEAALVRDGAVSPADLTDADRAGFRRTIAQRTLYGVDLNPMAVQLARLSLWLATLAGERPLTFFDHHLRAGNSLVGARVSEILSTTAGRKRPRDTALPLLDTIAALECAIGTGVTAAASIRDGLEDTLAQVRAKEVLFATMQSDQAPLHDWKAVADLWCSAWFGAERPLSRQVFAALLHTIQGGQRTLPPATTQYLLAEGREIGARERFFHWELEFPEVFFTPEGTRAQNPGFDAILGNPPWEVLRGDAGDAETRAAARKASGSLTAFSRGSALYRLQGTGHANLYQMFVERALTLLRRGGRCGLVLPSGIAADHGCGRLRRHLLDATSIDSWVVVENRAGLFPIHRGLKFVLVTLSNTGSTTTVPVRAGVSTATAFDELPHDERDAAAVPLSRALIERLCGDQLAIPDIHSSVDAEIAARAAFNHLPIAAPDGWHLRFGRELNATDDREHFNSQDGLPVVEGKQIQPFSVDVQASRSRVSRAVVQRLLRDATFDRARLAYRDVASATNRLTLIAGILPAGTVSTHTIFCLKTPLDDEAQLFVLGLFNSFVVNFLVRLRVTTHVTVAIVEQLPLPKPARTAPEFLTMTHHVRRLLADPSDARVMAQVQALAARLYGLERQEFTHVLSTFPLIDESVRRAAMEAFLGTI
jgi:hypothetical protein